MERMGKALTTQKILADLKGRQRQLSVLLKGFSLTGSQEKFGDFYRESVTISAKIENLEKLIVPTGPSRMVGDYSTKASRGPEDRRKTSTTKKH